MKFPFFMFPVTVLLWESKSLHSFDHKCYKRNYFSANFLNGMLGPKISRNGLKHDNVMYKGQ